MPSIFHWFVVDETHCILIFSHSLDELSFSQSLYERGKKKEQEMLQWEENGKQHIQHGVNVRLNYLRNPYIKDYNEVLSPVWVCWFVTGACNIVESL